MQLNVKTGGGLRRHIGRDACLRVSSLGCIRGQAHTSASNWPTGSSHVALSAQRGAVSFRRESPGLVGSSVVLPLAMSNGRPKRWSHLAAGVAQQNSSPQTDSAGLEQQQALSDSTAVNSILPVPAGSFHRGGASSSSSPSSAAAPTEAASAAVLECDRMLQRVNSLLASHDPPLRNLPADPGSGPSGPAALHVPPENVKMLGAGGFSYVVDGELDGRTVAVKLLPMQPLPDALSPSPSAPAAPSERPANSAAAAADMAAWGWDQQDPIRELGLMYEIGAHPNIAGAIGHAVFTKRGKRTDGYAETDPGTPYQLGIAMERMPTDLFSMMEKTKENPKPLPLASVLKIMIQVALAVEFMHSKRHCHADLKPSNILINPETLEVKVADFGSSFRLAPGQHSRSFATEVSTKAYRSPEALYDGHYGYASDVWALGLLLCELLMGQVCYVEDEEAKMQRFEMLQEDYGKLCFLPENGEVECVPVPEHIRDLQSLALGCHKTSMRRRLLPREFRMRRLVESMLARDPLDRIGIDEALCRLQRMLREEQAGADAAAAVQTAGEDDEEADEPCLLA